LLTLEKNPAGAHENSCWDAGTIVCTTGIRQQRQQLYVKINVALSENASRTRYAIKIKLTLRK